jgi:hypothetical protein
MSRQLLTSAEVALRLRRSLPWFQRNRASLEARGFPAPVDGLGMRWDPVAIDRWLDALLPAAPMAEQAKAEATLIERARAMAAA